MSVMVGNIHSIKLIFQQSKMESLTRLIVETCNTWLLLEDLIDEVYLMEMIKPMETVNTKKSNPRCNLILDFAPFGSSHCAGLP